jgi:hypothetical protein
MEAFPDSRSKLILSDLLANRAQTSIPRDREHACKRGLASPFPSHDSKGLKRRLVKTPTHNKLLFGNVPAGAGTNCPLLDSRPVQFNETYYG